MLCAGWSGWPDHVCGQVAVIIVDLSSLEDGRARVIGFGMLTRFC